MVTVIILVSIFILVLNSEIIPRRISLEIRRYFPIVIAVLILGPMLFIFVLGTPVLLQYLLDTPLEIGDALSLSIGITVIVSVLVTFKGIFAWLESVSYLPHLQIDLHHLVCDKIGNAKPALEDSRWYRGLEEDPDIMLADTRRIETDLEIELSALIASIALVLYLRVFTITGFWLIEEDYILFMVAYIIFIFFSAIIGELHKYRKWRHLWIDYWTFIRNLSAPENTLLDSLEPIRYSLKTRINIEDVNLRPATDARKLASKYQLGSMNYDDPKQIEFVYWYDYISRKLNGLDQYLLDEFPVYQEFQEDFKKKCRRYSEEVFYSFLRRSQILEITSIANEMPAIFESVADSDMWNEIRNRRKEEIYELAIRELDSMRTLGAAPVPSSIAWLLGLFAFSISVLPYALTLGSAILAP